MKYTLLAAVGITALASTAMAQEAPAVGGFHVEVVGGYDNTSARVAHEDTAFPEDNVSESESTDGFVYGISAGYDFAFSNSGTFGVEVGYEQADNERCEEVYGGDAACFSLKRSLYAGVKGSTLLAPRTSLTAGIGYVNGKARLSYADPAFPSDNFAVSDNRDGLRLSLGLEQRFSSNFFGKIEYRFSDYKNYDFVDGTESYKLGFRRNQVVAGLGLRF
jgi:outer membrane immunogenic protein